jgi:hypothetical protein
MTAAVLSVTSAAASIAAMTVVASLIVNDLTDMIEEVVLAGESSARCDTQ